MSDLKISISIDARETKTGADEAKRAVRGVADEAEKTGRRVSSLFKVDYSAAVKQIKEYGDKIKNVGGQIQGFGQQLTVGVTLPIIGLGAAAIKSFADVELAVANISTIKPEIDTKQLFSQLNEMSTRIPQTAQELGDGLYNIFSSINVAPAQGLKLLEQFGKGATAAQTDAKTFGTAVLGVINAYKLSVEDAAHVSDVFFNTVNLGVVNGAELATELGTVTQAAKSAGVGFDELGAFIVGVTKEGGDAGQNINNLANFLQKLPTKQSSAALKQLGVDVQIDGKFRPVIEVLGDLKTKLDAMPEAARNLELQKIFPDAQARTGAQTLLSQLDAVKEALVVNKSVSGAAEEAYKKISATATIQFQLLKNTSVAILAEIGSAILPVLQPLIIFLAQNLIPAVKQGVETFKSFSPAMQTTAVAVVAIAAAIGPVLAVLGIFISFVGSIVGAVGTLIPIFAAVGGAVAAFGSAILGVGGFIIAFIGLIGEAGLVASFTALVSVIGSAIVPAIGAFLTALAPIVVGVAAVVAVVGVLIGVGVALFAAYQTNFGGLKDLVDSVFNSIVSTIQSGLQAIQDFWTTYGTLIITTATNIFNRIVEFIRPIMTEIVNTIRGGFQTAVEVVGPLMTQVFAFVKTNIVATAAIVRVVLAGIAEFWTQHGEQIKAIVYAVWTILKTIVVTGITQIVNVITLVLAVINGDWRAAWTAFKNIVQSGVTAAVTIFKSLNTLIYNALAFIATDVYNIGKNIIQGLINGITSGAAALYEKVSNIASSVIGIFKSVPEVRSPSRVTTRIGEFITEGLAVGIQNKESFAVNAAKKVSAAVVKAFQDAQKEFSKLAGASPETVQTIQRTNQTSDATSAQQEIVKLRGDLQINNDLPLPTDVAGTVAELKYLKERQKAIEDAIPPYQQLANIEKELREARAKDLEDFDKIKDSIATNGAAELLQAQKEFDLLGVTDDFEKKRIENAYELLKLRQQLSNDGYGEGQIQEAVDLARVENARVLEFLRLRQLKQESIDKDKKLNDERLKAADEAAKQYENKVKVLSDSLYRIFSAGAKDGFKGFLKQGLEELKNFGKKLLDDILGSLADSLSKFLLGKLSGKGSSDGSSGGGFLDIIKNLFGGRGAAGSSGETSSGGGFLNTIRGLFGGGGSSSGGSSPLSGGFNIGGSGTNIHEAGQSVGSSSGIGLAGGVAIAGAAANIIGGLIGGRTGSFISNIGSGAALGAQLGSIVPGIGTAIGAAVGAAGGFLVSLFGGDPKRKKDKKENLPALQKGFTEALAQIRALGADKNAFYSDPEGTISKAVELRGQIASGFGIKFESKKYQKQSQQEITAKLAEADTIIADLQRLKNRAVRAKDVDTQLQTSFATGIYLRDDQMSDMKRALDFKRRNGKLAGKFDGVDTLPSMLAKGEMVLNPTQIQNVILNAGDDPFKNAGIPGYNTGIYIAPSAPSASATVAPVNSSAPNIKIENITLVVEKDENGNVSFKELLVDNLKKSDVQVQVVESYDKGKSRNR